MITIRKSDDRGHFDHGWLNTYHTFSFGDYYDPKQMGFRSLRVINEDRLQPDTGFGAHPHRDMEILTYVLDGALEHRDSLGNGSIIRPGDVQRMSAGTGVRHSEKNPSRSEPVHLLQIWILPSQHGLTPSYEQKSFSDAEKHGHFRLVASPDGRDGSVLIHQDARLYATVLEAGQSVSYALPPGRYAWLQMARGSVDLDGTVLRAGDGAAAGEKGALKLTGAETAEVLLFELS